ncbi:MAG TPA: gluconate 2-dehydrogenase subunit 3 family protein [Candidatus Acidoferrum sp.]
MSANSKLPVLNVASGQRPISRRELAQKLLAGVAFSFSAIHPIRRHLLNATLLDSAAARLAANEKPLFLSTWHLKSLDVLAEAIIPGSRESQSPQFIDLLLSADAPDVQQEFMTSLNVVDFTSHSVFQTHVAALSNTRLHELLTTLSSPTSDAYKHFENLKTWIAGAHYSSEIGMRELGWTPDRVFPEFPTCPHPQGHS